MYEVEMKFRIDDIGLFERQLKERGIIFSKDAVEEVDLFYSHPQRDFNQTDECLRVRVRKFVDGKKENFLTYKGQKIDKETKTRRELEVRIDDVETLQGILAALGFCAVESVRKFRRSSEIMVSGSRVEILLDFLPELSDENKILNNNSKDSINSSKDYVNDSNDSINSSKEASDNNSGEYFVELETISLESDLELSKRLIMDFAKELNLTKSIRASYLSLLRQKKQESINTISRQR
ncbi:MAG: class IV adenylate cyclase [Planctomycetaceae bacterium]|jgi:adenylate cyclase class 2|nr:class IV adenylate cyclase [Planctomycetaceae bacterium]